MSGIERERIVNKEMLELFGEYINCFECKMIVKDPYTCEDCETSCCKSCFKSEFICKKCKSKNLKFFPAVFKNFLNSLQITCKFISCGHISTYNKLDEHENFCFEKVNISSCQSKNDNKDIFFKSFENIETSLVIESEIEKENDQKNEDCNDCTDKQKLINDLSSEYVNKNANEVGSVLSDNFDDKFSKISLNFMDSLQINTKLEKNIGESEMQLISNLAVNKVENEKDLIIKALSMRINNLEKLCTSIISETQGLKNTFKCVQMSSGNNIFTQNPKIQNIQANQNLLSQKGVLVFNNCSICARITNIKIQLKCENCTKTVCPDCYYNCEKCGVVTCKACGNCSLCKGSKYCYGCKFSCGQCIKNKNVFCKECIKSCEVCCKQDQFCKRCCAFKCKDCNKISCLKCIWNCKSCYLSYCINYPNDDCKLCGGKNCAACLKKCIICERNNCVSCVVECKKCIGIVCKKCCVNVGKDKMCKNCLK